MINPEYDKILNDNSDTFQYKGDIQCKLVKEYCTYVPFLGQLTEDQYRYIGFEFEEKLNGFWDSLKDTLKWENN